MYRFRIKANAMIFTGWLLVVVGARSPAQMPAGWCGMEGMMAQSTCTRGACDEPVNRDPWIANPSSPLLTVHLRFNVFCEDNGTGCVASQATLNAQVADLNNAFRDVYGIQFPTPPDTVFISRGRFKHFCSDPNVTCRCGGDPPALCGEELAMKTQYANDPAHKLNIYVVNVERPPPIGFTGLGYFPWYPNATAAGGGIIIDKDVIGGLRCGPSGIAPCLVLGHEIGHNLGLWHNFHGVDEVPACSQCFEIAQCNGDCSYPGCDAVGDLCCDTAATETRSTCSHEAYVVGCVPPFPPFSPDEATYKNYMNYAGDGCWDRFSSQQTGRMRCWTCDTLKGWIVGQDCNNNGIPDQCESPSPIGACCVGGACMLESELCCSSQGGTFIGEGVTCDDCNGNEAPDVCEEAGLRACCLPGGQCILWTAECCSAVGGEFYPNKNKCLDVYCALAPVPGP